MASTTTAASSSPQRATVADSKREQMASAASGAAASASSLMWSASSLDDDDDDDDDDVGIAARTVPFRNVMEGSWNDREEEEEETMPRRQEEGREQVGGGSGSGGGGGAQDSGEEQEKQQAAAAAAAAAASSSAISPSSVRLSLSSSGSSSVPPPAMSTIDSVGAEGNRNAADAASRTRLGSDGIDRGMMGGTHNFFGLYPPPHGRQGSNASLVLQQSHSYYDSDGEASAGNSSIVFSSNTNNNSNNSNNNNSNNNGNSNSNSNSHSSNNSNNNNGKFRPPPQQQAFQKHHERLPSTDSLVKRLSPPQAPVAATTSLASGGGGAAKDGSSARVLPYHFRKTLRQGASKNTTETTSTTASTWQKPPSMQRGLDRHASELTTKADNLGGNVADDDDDDDDDQEEELRGMAKVPYGMAPPPSNMYGQAVPHPPPGHQFGPPMYGGVPMGPYGPFPFPPPPGAPYAMPPFGPMPPQQQHHPSSLPSSQHHQQQRNHMPPSQQSFLAFGMPPPPPPPHQVASRTSAGGGGRSSLAARGRMPSTDSNTNNSIPMSPPDHKDAPPLHPSFPSRVQRVRSAPVVEGGAPPPQPPAQFGLAGMVFPMSGGGGGGAGGGAPWPAAGPFSPPAPSQAQAPYPISHVRQESSGSVSSLGSVGNGNGSGSGSGGGGGLTDRLGQDIAGFLQGEKKTEKPRGFFSGLFPPSFQRAKSIEDETRNYHAKNQAFLNKARNLNQQQQQKVMQRDLSPTHGAPRRPVVRSSSPRPPPVSGRGGGHRPGLSSIDNDDWEEEDIQDRPALKGRTIKNAPSGRPPSGGGRAKAAAAAAAAAAASSARPGHGRRRQRAESSDYYSSESDDDDDGAGDGDDSDDEASFSVVGSSMTDGDEELEGRGHQRRHDDDDDNEEEDDDDEEEEEDANAAVNERTSLLPPSGISTREHRGNDHVYGDAEYQDENRALSRHGSGISSGRRGRKNKGGEPDSRRHKSSKRRGGTQQQQHQHQQPHYDAAQQHQHQQQQQQQRGRGRHHDIEMTVSSESEEDDYSVMSRRQRRMYKMEKEIRERIMAEMEAQKWHNRLWRYSEKRVATFCDRYRNVIVKCETFISNLPMTIGAIAMALVSLGVVWFKFAEENLDSCIPVHFHTKECTFPEFPGCFYCDTTTWWYHVALSFHYFCSIMSGILVSLIILKVFVARRVVVDEMSSPTTSSPAGLMCMTLVCVFAGRGWIGKLLVCGAAALHLLLAMWFIYMALAYHIMPEPSWYPNTAGIGMSAVKTWLYYPIPGHFLMAVSLSLCFFLFPISVIRVTLNKKISATVGWIQMSAPAIALYALTIMAQPSFQEEHPDVTKFERVHRMVYLPCMHVMFFLSVIGFFSSVQSLVARWAVFSKKEFSPAHAAFCFPTLAHANAVQAYRGAVDSFSTIPLGSPPKIVLYTYWLIVLLGGTVATIVITAKFFYRLPSWTLIDVADEVEPPAPDQTAVSEVIGTEDAWRQDFISPAILQAQETGVLVRVGPQQFVRTRKVTALGFEPILNAMELAEEREALLEFVAKNPPRFRKRTLSVPGIDFAYGSFGTGNVGVFDDDGRQGMLRSSSPPRMDPSGRLRAQTGEARYSTARGGGGATAPRWHYGTQGR